MTRFLPHRLTPLVMALLAATGAAGIAGSASALPSSSTSTVPTAIPAWVPDHPGDRAVVAIVGENGGAARYGRRTAQGVAADFEYPGDTR